MSSHRKRRRVSQKVIRARGHSVRTFQFRDEGVSQNGTKGEKGFLSKTDVLFTND